jgi:4-hydroxy-4-methyl-2-oxoglutarate aldolase
MVHVAVEELRPGDVLVIVPTGPSKDAYFGDLLATAARARGCVGAIIVGGVRDVRELTAMRFPVWSVAVCANATTKRQLGTVNLPVTCGGEVIRPGDLLVADDDGACLVAAVRTAEVLERARARAEEEEHLRRRLALGETTVEVFEMREKLVGAGLRYAWAGSRACRGAGSEGCR